MKQLSETIQNMVRMKPVALFRRDILLQNRTAAEIEFCRLLNSKNLVFEEQKIVYTPDDFFILDFVVHSYPKTIFEIDGGSHVEKGESDRRRTVAIKQTRWRNYGIIRLTNEEVFSGYADDLLRRRWRA